MFLAVVIIVILELYGFLAFFPQPLKIAGLIF